MLTYPSKILKPLLVLLTVGPHACSRHPVPGLPETGGIVVLKEGRLRTFDLRFCEEHGVASAGVRLYTANSPVGGVSAGASGGA